MNWGLEWDSIDTLADCGLLPGPAVHLCVSSRKPTVNGGYLVQHCFFSHGADQSGPGQQNVWVTATLQCKSLPRDLSRQRPGHPLSPRTTYRLLPVEHELDRWTVSAAFPACHRESVCTIPLIGDGSQQLTVQDLSTMLPHGVTLSIFVLDNVCYTTERCTGGIARRTTSWNGSGGGYLACWAATRRVWCGGRIWCTPSTSRRRC
ncbi:hypothetical protein B0H15DRAFT_163773 [Mycena belliarum]|uniref:Uncharacterized protein n=1 Tax=Mycena belliarum TaxID=1033014 RepID=A0AAD6U9H3_9AGAR|nr:hypothetical protein B0H15DRAFT_163773 [Mycena belliae]